MFRNILACLMLKMSLMLGKNWKCFFFSKKISQNLADQVVDQIADVDIENVAEDALDGIAAGIDAIGNIDTGAILDNAGDLIGDAVDAAQDAVDGILDSSEGKVAASCALTAVLFFIQ